MVQKIHSKIPGNQGGRAEGRVVPTPSGPGKRLLIGPWGFIPPPWVYLFATLPTEGATNLKVKSGEEEAQHRSPVSLF